MIFDRRCACLAFTSECTPTTWAIRVVHFMLTDLYMACAHVLVVVRTTELNRIANVFEVSAFAMHFKIGLHHAYALDMDSAIVNI